MFVNSVAHFLVSLNRFLNQHALLELCGVILNSFFAQRSNCNQHKKWVNSIHNYGAEGMMIEA